MPFPLTTGDDVQDFATLEELWLGMSERYRVVQGPWWPRQSTPLGGGVVPAGITATGFTDANANDGDGWDDTGTDQNPWTKTAVDHRLDGMSSWILMIDDCDPRKVIRATVTGWTATAITFASILDYVTAGYVPSLASLVGKSYYLLRGDYGITWAERYMDTPNDYTFADGVVAEFHDDPDHPATVTNPTDQSLKQTTEGAWVVDEHAGRDLLVYVVGGGAGVGNLRRVTIDSNTADTLTFAAQSWTPAVGAAYCIVGAGGRAYPGKARVYPFAWYRGSTEGIFAHTPLPATGPGAPPLDAFVGSTLIPLHEHTHGDFNGLSGCVTVHPTAFDVDYITDFEVNDDRSGCGYPSDKVFSPDFWKSLRALELGCEDVCTRYVESKSYTGLASIPLLVPATFFKAWGKNAATTAATAFDAVGGTVTVPTLDYPFFPIDLHFAVLGGDGDVIRHGVTTADDATTLGAGGLWGADDVGRTIVLSAGWDRYFPREFQRYYPKCCFIPDTVTDDDGVESAVDAPGVVDYAVSACLGVGRWEYRAPSSKYWEHGLFQQPAEGDDLVAGELARYVGDSYFDGIEGAISEVIAPYADHFYTGSLGPSLDVQRAAQRAGTAASATAFSVTDPDQDWFDPRWYDGAAGVTSRVEEGTFTSGSTTAGTDSTKASGEANCWWAATRFTNLQPFERFTVEVRTSGASWDADDAVIERRLIRTGSAAGALTWSEPLSASASGKDYRIYEPAYELNRFRGRTARLVDAEGTAATVTVEGNDATTFFFDALPDALVAPVSYAIEEEEVGDVYRWDGSAHVRVDASTGADAVRTFVPVPHDFVSPSRCNLPTYVKRFGRMRCGDDPVPVMQQLYLAMKALRKTRNSITWTNVIGGVAVDNDRSALAGNTEDWPRGGWTKDDYRGHPATLSDVNGCELAYLNDVGPFPSDADSWGYMWGILRDGDGGTLNAPYDCTATGTHDGWTAQPTTDVGGLAPMVLASGGITFAGMYASAERRFAYAEATVDQPPCPIANQLTYYAYAIIEEGDPDEGGSCDGSGDWNEFRFDAHADPLIFRKFSQWYAETSYTTDVDRISGPLGVNSLADPPNTPPLPSPDGGCPSPTIQTTQDGYLVSEAWAVADWEFQHCA